VSRFSEIIILGSSTIACECLRVLSSEHVTHVVETKESQVSLLRTIAGKFGVPYAKIVTRSELNAFLMGLSWNGKMLVISADNELIINSDFTDRPNLEIINFHYGLLPDYRGMNIPSWVIFNGETKTGVTWHYINAKIDDGAIIAQAEIPISETTTAFDIVRQTMRIGPKVFREFIVDFLTKEPCTFPNVKPPSGGHEYKRNDLPGGGEYAQIWRRACARGLRGRGTMVRSRFSPIWYMRPKE